MTMTPDQFRSITKGRFFTVCFRKKDGSIRELNGLDRVKSYIKGTGKPITDGRVIVWDRKVFRQELTAGKPRRQAGERAYRSFWPDTLIWVKVGGKKYDAEGHELKE